MSTSDLSSYPPLFRRPNNTTQSHQTPNSNESTHSNSDSADLLLPLIDFRHLHPEKLGKACRDWGVFRLINHGVPVTLLEQLQDQAKQLFSLSFESKMALFTDPITYFWSTPALTAEGVAQNVRNINWVEGFNVPLSQLSLPHSEDLVTLNSFRSHLEEYGRHMGRISKALFEAMLMELKLDPVLYKPYLSESTGFIRAYRYPKCFEDSQVSGMEAHTDSSVLALLNQDDVGGLQVYRNNSWVEVKPVSSTLVVNLGDMMQAMSNEEYKSVTHRVKVNSRMERFSICYFVFPGEDCVIRSTRYKPFTYRQFQAQVRQDIKATGAKVGLDRFRMG